MASSMSSVMQAPKVVEKYCVCHLSTGVGVCIPCVCCNVTWIYIFA